MGSGTGHPDAHGGHARAAAARQARRSWRYDRDRARLRLSSASPARPTGVTLARRLLAGSLIVVMALVAAIVLIAGGRLRDRLVEEKRDELARVGRAVALQWQPGTDADEIANRAGDALGYRVTLIDSTGVVVGDAEFGPEARRRLENHLNRPEIVEARSRGLGASRRHRDRKSVVKGHSV